MVDTEHEVILRAIVSQNTTSGIADGYRIAQMAFHLGLKQALATADKLEAETLERAAKVAEQWVDPIMATDHENLCFRSIATAIRNLKDQTNG